MNIDILIRRLKKIKEQDGDLPIFVWDRDSGSVIEAKWIFPIEGHDGRPGITLV